MSKYFRKKVLMSKLCKTMLSFISQVRRLHPTLRVSNQLPDREGSACKAINCEHMSLSQHLSIILMQAEDKREWLH